MKTEDTLLLAGLMGLTSESNANEQQIINDLSVVLTSFTIDNNHTEHFSEKTKQFWLRALPPVIFMKNQLQLDFDLHLPIEFVTEDLIWQLCDQQGRVIETGEFTPIEWQLNGIYHLHDMEIQSYQINLEQSLSLADCQLLILDQGNDEPLGSARVISAPEVLTVSIPAKLDSELNGVDNAANELFLVLIDSAIENQKLALSTDSKVNLAALQQIFTQQVTTDSSEKTSVDNFATWLIAQTPNYLINSKLTVTLSFTDVFNNALARWLLADYCSNLNDAGNGIVNSYQMREDGYYSWSLYLELVTANSEVLVLTDPLSFAQKWIAVGDSGVWQHHEFHELMSLLIYHCQKNSCACYYQGSDLPEEVETYLTERGISKYLLDIK